MFEQLLTNTVDYEEVYPIRFPCSAIPIPKSKSLGFSQQGQANVKALLKIGIEVSDVDVSFRVSYGTEVLGSQLVPLASDRSRRL